MPTAKRIAPELARAPLWRSRGFRWGAVFAIVLACGFLAMFALVFWRGTALMFETLDRSVLEQLELLSARPPDLLPFMIASRMDPQPNVVTQVGLFEPGGKLIVGDIPAIPAGLTPDGAVHDVAAPGNPKAHWRAAQRILPSGRVLVVARPSDEIREASSGLMRGAVIALVPAMLLSLGGGAFVGVATERRLRQINSVAERIIEGELHERLPGRFDGDELERMCAIVNRMLDRFEDNVKGLQRVGDNIAHDLRTPLTSLRARLERIGRLAGSGTEIAEAIGASIQNVDQSLSIVRALLRIADIRHVRRESGFQPIDLPELVSETAEIHQPLAEQKGIVLTWSSVGPATVIGDRQLIVEALVNLVDNAIKFSPPGATVKISVDGDPAAPIITVADSGPGIPAEIRSWVWQRFYRADPSGNTNGNGLGLNLVAEIVKLHGFSVELGDDGPGCRVSISCFRRSQHRVNAGMENAPV